MCEDFVGYYKRGPFLFYHLTAEQRFCSVAVRGCRPSRAPFCPHEGFLSFTLRFFPFNVHSCVIGFQAHRLATAICSQFRYKVSCDSCDVAVTAILLQSRAQVQFHPTSYVQTRLRQNTSDIL